MENREQIFEDLQYMKQIIKDSRKMVVDKGLGFIVWGIIIIIGLTASYIDFVTSGDQYSAELWILLIGGGWIYTAVLWYKHRGEKRAETFAGKILGSVWFSAGVAMTILGFVGTYAGAYEPVFISPVLAAVLGIAFYVSALIYDNLLMKYLAPLWWAGSIFMFFFPGLHTIIVMAAMMLLLQVVPGIILYKKYKSGN
jgi:hypothetical protein